MVIVLEEECDCGPPENCVSNCCDAATCKLRKNAACATGKDVPKLFNCCKNVKYWAVKMYLCVNYLFILYTVLFCQYPVINFSHQQ